MDGACPRCGAPVPAGARFCMSCGAALEPAAAPVEERRLVSILFADLEGFTARSDAADPEDVRRTLVPFHARAKEAIERYGGTLDKFIGDAAMGVFGAPVAHGDDAERAVRAALGILEAMAELRERDPSLGVRVAVNTGEAVVAFGEGPQVGEAVAGDVVNTASRLQSIAPRDGLVIGEETWRSVRERFETEERDAVGVKGKATPLRIWRVLGERTADARTDAASFVGRERELAILRTHLARVAERNDPELVVVVAPAGVGKSRLVEEFERGSSVRWLPGACAPYGEGVTFRALADVVLAAAGIDRRTATAEDVREELASLSAHIESGGSEREWLYERLAAIVGIVLGDQVHRSAPVREYAAACAAVVAHAASASPVVVLVEDAHWAEPSLLEAIGFLLDELAGVPALVVCTGRPEIEERIGGWVGRPDTEVVSLSELAPSESRILIRELLTRTVASEDLEGTLLERSGGNPLFALEFVRMLVEAGGELPATSGSVPTSVRAVISARLDAIPSSSRGPLQDAAVVGGTFWAGAVEALADDGNAVADALDDLRRRRLVRTLAEGGLPAEPAFGFTHALIREVAYGRLPRIVRSHKHRKVGAWLEDRVGDRPGTSAAVVANHFAVATELAIAAGDDVLVDLARPSALRWLRVAADTAAGVDERASFDALARLLALAPAGSIEHAYALGRSAELGRRTGALGSDEVLERMEAALAEARALGDARETGAALVRLGSRLGSMGEGRRATEAFAEAVEVLRPLPPGRELAQALAFRAEEEMFAGHVDPSLARADEALALAREVGADDVAIIALHIRGDGRCSTGDLGGLADLGEALAIAERRGVASDIVISRSYLGEWRCLRDGPAAALPDYEGAIALAERRGALSQGDQAKVVALELQVDVGRWDQASRRAEELLGLEPGRLDEPFQVIARAVRAWLALQRDGEAVEDPDELVALAAPTGTLQIESRALAVAACLAAASGRAEDAIGFVDAFDGLTRDVSPLTRATNAPTIARVCQDLGDAGRAARIAAPLDVRTPYERIHLDAAAAIAGEMTAELGDAERRYADVARRWSAFGCPFEAAAAALGRGRCLATLDRPEEARAALRAARASFTELGAGPWIARVDAVDV
ncbi:MAG TPA: adenylate/guanylate cyclase domain-containing protein [Actinomycetota bacterium]|nr:adenylate/guanylate cyclase domain-containing protein [Actinomycetota bacterium]